MIHNQRKGVKEEEIQFLSYQGKQMSKNTNIHAWEHILLFIKILSLKTKALEPYSIVQYLP